MRAEAKFAYTGLTDGWLRVPEEIKVDGEHLISCGRQFKYRRVTPAILDDFLDLDRTKDPQAVLRFAKRFGVLSLCDHGLPMYHNQKEPGVIAAGECGEVSVPRSPEWSQEPISRWLDLAAVGAAARRAAAMVRLGAKPKAGDLLSCLFGRPGLESLGFNEQALARAIGQRRPNRTSREHWRTAFAGSVERLIREWMFFGGVRPTVEWNVDEFHVGFTTGDRVTTFGAIAVELLLDVADLRSIAACKACRGFFRSSSHRERSFCPSCRGTNRQWAYLKREQRARQRAKKP